MSCGCCAGRNGVVVGAGQSLVGLVGWWAGKRRAPARSGMLGRRRARRVINASANELSGHWAAAGSRWLSWGSALGKDCVMERRAAGEASWPNKVEVSLPVVSWVGYLVRRYLTGVAGRRGTSPTKSSLSHDDAGCSLRRRNLAGFAAGGVHLVGCSGR